MVAKAGAATMKTVQDSRVEMRMLVMPNDTNPLGTIFGGVVMGWIDMAASMTSERHAGKPAVTAHVSDISFKAPIFAGDHCLIQASINHAGRTSMLVGVKVSAENPKTGEVRHTTTAYLVFVALDGAGRPAAVPPLEVRTDEERRRRDEGRRICERIKAKRA